MSPGSNQSPCSLLVADDEIEISEIVQAIAEDLGFTVTCVHEGLKVVELVERIKPDVIALDLRMPGADGVEIIRELGNRKCSASIVLMSGMDQRTLTSVQTLGREQALAIISTLTKPMSVADIEATLRPLLKAAPETPPAKPVVQEASSNYGLSINYEPELTINPLKNDTQARVRAIPGWRKDSGEILQSKHLYEWAAREDISKGISKLLLTNALTALTDWAGIGFNPALAIKLESSWFLELGIPDTLATIVDSFEIPRELITLEVDESTISNNQSTLVDVLSRLRIKGFQLSVCVEGEGETILSAIDSLPIDRVVLDMEYMSRHPNFLSNMETEFLYSSLTSMANHKGIATCATNVSSSDILTFVQRCNFNSARGSELFAPVPCDHIPPLYGDGDIKSKLTNN